jgi:hypothetical protein
VPTSLRSQPVAPPGPQIHERVEAERGQLAEVNALRLLGRVGPAQDKVTAIEARAKPLAYRPLDAELLLVRGDLTDRSGDSAGAIKQLDEAVVAADAGNHRLVSAQAWSTLAWIEGFEERQFDKANFAVRMAGSQRASR